MKQGLTEGISTPAEGNKKGAFTRRKFIKTTTLASATLMPVANVLASDLVREEDDLAFLNKKIKDLFARGSDFHVVGKNLLNLHFYFINTERNGKYLFRRTRNTKSSFMIVRLPQMHLAEEGFFRDGSSVDLPDFAEAKLSGHSFLAFELWPGQEGKPRRFNRISFEINELLNWNSSYFSLITLLDWHLIKGVDINNNPLVDLEQWRMGDGKEILCNTFNGGEESDAANSSFYKSQNRFLDESNFSFYSKMVHAFFEKSLNKTEDFVPITLFEVPEGVCLVPLNRDPQFRPNFGKNILVKDGKLSRRFPKYYSKFEVWNNEFFYRNETNDFEVQTPTFRIAGIINRNSTSDEHDEVLAKLEKVSEGGCPDFDCNEQCAEQQEKNFLPNLLDKRELAYLTQYAKNENLDFTQKDFDIVEQNGFFFTGLGIITHLKYYNLDKLPPCIDLIEYEHKITQGRDVYVKVARLGYNSKTGQRYKHVIEGKRNIEEGSSFMELKQYCECIDKHLDYNQDKYRPCNNNLEYFNIPEPDYKFSAITRPIHNHSVDFKRLPFVEIENIVRKKIPIKCLIPIDYSDPLNIEEQISEQNVCDLQCLDWFWPIQASKVESSEVANFKPEYEDYLHCENVATDWDGNAITLRTPFIFLRKSFLERQTGDGGRDLKVLYNHYFNEDKDGEEDNYTKRRKTFLQKQKISFTPNRNNVGKDFKDLDPLTFTIAKSIVHDTYDGDDELVSNQERRLITERELRKTFAKDNIDDNRFDKILENLENLKLIGASPKSQGIIGLVTRSKLEEVRKGNKVNNIETHFIDTYFVLRKDDWQSQSMVNTPYVVYPQLLRAQVSPNHVKDLINEDIPVVMEYHDDYIGYGFDGYNKVVDGTIIGNGSSIILANTDAFIEGDEERNNNTYNQIRAALVRAKKHIGNLFVSDSIIDVLSLEKVAGSLPKDIRSSIQKGRTLLDENNGISKIDPRKLLRKEFKDICGLDLTFILEEYIDELPTQEIITEINQIGESVKKSEFYQDFQGILDIAESSIKEFERKYDELLTELDYARTTYNEHIKSLNNLVPNENDIQKLIDHVIERYRFEAFHKFLKYFELEEGITKICSSDESIVQINKEIIEFVQSQFVELMVHAEEKYIELTRYCDELKSKLEDFNQSVDFRFSNEVKLIENSLNGLVFDFQDVFEGFKVGQFDMVKSLEKHAKRVEDSVKVNCNKAKMSINYAGQIVPVLIDRNNLKLIPFEKTLGKAQYDLYREENENIYFLELSDSTGAEQLERNIVDLKRVVAKNDSEHPYIKTVIAFLNQKIKAYEAFRNKIYSNPILQITNKYSEISEQFEAIENQLTLSQVEQFKRIKEGVVLIKGIMALVEKLYPEFYQNKLGQIEGDLDEIKERLKQVNFNLWISIEKTIDNYLPQCSQRISTCYSELISIAKTGISNGSVNSIFFSEEYSLIKSKYKRLLQTCDEEIRETITEEIGQIVGDFTNLDEVKKLREDLEVFKRKIEYLEDNLKNHLTHEKIKMEESVIALGYKFEEWLIDQYDKYEGEIEKIKELERIFKLLKSIKQKDITFLWGLKGNEFRNRDFGPLSFKAQSDTELLIDFKSTIYFEPDTFPQVTDRIESRGFNTFRNFNLEIFNSLSIGFTEISFKTGTNLPSEFDVSINDIKFIGVLSFVQAFEEYLKSLGFGLVKEVGPNYIRLAHSIEIPAIQTPSFSFYDLVFHFDFRIYFTNDPIELGFSVAKRDKMFRLSVGVYSGFGFFGIVVNPKQGIVTLETALEGGAWAGIRFGPIRGEVRMGFGFYFRKDVSGTLLEGYFVAEGKLSVWIIRVHARVYLAIRSINGNIIGYGIVTVSIKVFGRRKKFKGSYTKEFLKSEKRNSGSNKLQAEFTKHKQIFKIEDIGIDQLETSEKLVKVYDEVSLEEWDEFITNF